jgi:hypothetical protein
MAGEKQLRLNSQLARTVQGFCTTKGLQVATSAAGRSVAVQTQAVPCEAWHYAAFSSSSSSSSSN